MGRSKRMEEKEEKREMRVEGRKKRIALESGQRWKGG